MSDEDKTCDISSAQTRPPVTQEQFDAMTASEKRVAIATDVIEQLDAKRIVAKRGVYLTIKNPNSQFDNHEFYLNRLLPNGENVASVTNDTELRDVLARNPQPCVVCALGAGFLSAVRLADRLTVGQMAGSDMDGMKVDQQTFVGSEFRMRRYLGQFFSGEQVGLLETAFESVAMYASGAGVDPNATMRAVNLLRNDTADDAIRAIWQNVADNGGEFVP